ncbi:MAG: class I SAM-dependent methyltransferase [bacterium]
MSVDSSKPRNGNVSQREKWNQRYQGMDIEGAEAADVLSLYAHLLPSEGVALDLACGRGGNAVFLASRGLSCEAWDLSGVAVDKLNHFAAIKDLPLVAREVDVETFPPPPASFDVIVVSHFLYRPLFPHLVDALKPGGLLYYQTFIRQQVPGGSGPGNPDFLLRPNELLKAVPSLLVRAYREDALQGDLTLGVRNVALLVAQKVPK